MTTEGMIFDARNLLYSPGLSLTRGKNHSPYPLCAGEDSIIVGRFDAKYAYKTFAKVELNPPHAYAAIILAVDNPSDAGWPSGTPTPVPSWLVLNTRARTPTRRAGGLHVVYALILS